MTNQPQTDFYRFTQANDRRYVNHLLATIFSEEGNVVSVNDGEEWCLRKASTRAQVRNALATTGEDLLRVRDSDGYIVGWFYLVYNEDEDLGAVLCDYSANEWSERTVQKTDESLGMC